MKNSLLRLGKLIAYPLISISCILLVFVFFLFILIYGVFWGIQHPLWYMLYGKEACGGFALNSDDYKKYPTRYYFEAFFERGELIFVPFDWVTNWKW